MDKRPKQTEATIFDMQSPRGFTRPPNAARCTWLWSREQRRRIRLQRSAELEDQRELHVYFARLYALHLARTNSNALGKFFLSQTARDSFFGSGRI